MAVKRSRWDPETLWSADHSWTFTGTASCGGQAQRRRRMSGRSTTRRNGRRSGCSEVSQPGVLGPAEEVGVRTGRCQARTSRLVVNKSRGCGVLAPLAPKPACRRLTGASLAGLEEELADGPIYCTQEGLCEEPPPSLSYGSCGLPRWRLAPYPFRRI
ncbi:hypothetical protein NDU88_001551 [Pleurodeles waltl]|uniref:Uncharacterized protein n=1 Tax=Pleurodeles waltl TaxID=8319 RepID=A0AAV7VZU3_PLEWA|nr:hypothetical protein NDU88_001551 [Pleurodeles waltl]